MFVKYGFLKKLILFLAFLYVLLFGVFASYSKSSEWIAEKPDTTKYLYEVGSSGLSNISVAKKEAIANARSGLCKRIADVVDLKFMQDSENFNHFKQEYENCSLEFYQMILSKINVERTYKDDAFYVLISLKKSDVTEQYKTLIDKYLATYEEQKADAERKLNNLMNLIEKSTPTDELVLLKEKAVSKANEIIKNCEDLIQVFGNKNLFTDFEKEIEKL